MTVLLPDEAEDLRVTESELMERFTAMYESTRAPVYAYAVSRAGRQLAEEIVSEVYLVA